MIKKKYIWGLDLSMSDSGIVIMDNNTPVFIGNIPTDSKNTHGQRLKKIYDNLNVLKDEFPPKVVCIERGFNRFNISTAVLYRVHGVVNMLFYDIEQIYYPPKTIKETILKGNATKTELMNAIKKIYPNVEFKNDNESDAFAIVLTYLIKEGGGLSANIDKKQV